VKTEAKTRRPGSRYDITFIGHMCYDEIVPFEGEAHVAPGSAVLCGAMSAASTGRRIAAIVRMAEADAEIVEPMREAGVEVRIVPAPVTTYNRVIHPSADVDEREMVMVRDAGRFRFEELPAFESSCVHLAGISDREFDLAFLRALSGTGVSLSTDMQSFVRQVDPDTREIRFADVPEKREIVALLDKVKLDVVEGELLTGEKDIGRAAAAIAGWGCGEVVITHSEGVLARVDGREHYERFSNRSVAGRTGRGDTTFAAYLCRRMEEGPAASLKFAAALVSLKMERPGPFRGTLADVLRRMKEAHRG
jgi:sugar/nucleoside kinase (ribokinase family)